jgi:transcriptional repressor NrdR
MVLKRDGRREPFDAGKIRQALRIACRKRPVSADAIERVVGRVALSVDESPEQELPSEEIGRRLLEELAAVDEVSFARFASVYLRFERLADFVQLAQRQAVAPEDGSLDEVAVQEELPEA